MDRVPPKLPNISSRLIAMAVALVGESQSVMLEMRCSHRDFLDYCAGRQEPTGEELHRLVELVVAEQRKLIEKNRELLAQVPDKQGSS